jgi:hypothetical protein
MSEKRCYRDDDRPCPSHEDFKDVKCVAWDDEASDCSFVLAAKSKYKQRRGVHHPSSAPPPEVR